MIFSTPLGGKKQTVFMCFIGPYDFRDVENVDE